MQAHEIEREAVTMLAGLGLDQAAKLIAGLLDTTDVDDMPDGWLEGVEDALNTLVHAGATDPR